MILGKWLRDVNTAAMYIYIYICKSFVIGARERIAGNFVTGFMR